MTEVILDFSDFSRKLLDSSPNWTDAERLNFDYLDVQQIIIGTFFSAKEGTHRLKVRNDPVTVGEFLLDFSGGPMTKIYLVVKYWIAKDKQERYKKEQNNSRSFLDNITQESGFDDSFFKKEESQTCTTLFVGQEVSLLIYVVYFSNISQTNELII